MASSNHRCSIECGPSDILARSVANSAQYTQLQCGRNPRSVLQNVYLVSNKLVHQNDTQTSVYAWF